VLKYPVQRIKLTGFQVFYQRVQFLGKEVRQIGERPENHEKYQTDRDKGGQGPPSHKPEDKTVDRVEDDGNYHGPSYSREKGRQNSITQIPENKNEKNQNYSIKSVRYYAAFPFSLE
jgi:hypothetical protein